MILLPFVQDALGNFRTLKMQANCQWLHFHCMHQYNILDIQPYSDCTIDYLLDRSRFTLHNLVNRKSPADRYLYTDRVCVRHEQVDGLQVQGSNRRCLDLPLMSLACHFLISAGVISSIFLFSK